MINPAGTKKIGLVQKGDVREIGTVRVVTNTTTELVDDELIICNKATVMTVNLLAATGSRRELKISSINDGVVTVTPNGADTINGEVSQAIYNGSCMVIEDYAVNKWLIT